MVHFWHWLMDFTGVNNGEDPFATHMYNFWSGFGGNVSILALGGILLAVYRHYNKYLRAVNPVNIIKAPFKVSRRKDK